MAALPINGGMLEKKRTNGDKNKFSAAKIRLLDMRRRQH